MSTTLTIERDQKRQTALDTRLCQWRMIRDCIEGEDAIKAGDAVYLPKPQNMDVRYNQNGDQLWQNYKARASYFGVAERTLLMLVGMATRTEPIVAGETPGILQPMLDGDAGQSLVELTDWLYTEILSVNRAGVLVDMEQERAVGQLPYAATYYAESIAEWRWEKRRGQKRIVYVKLAEDLTGDENAYEGYVATDRCRELYLEDGRYTVKVSVTHTPVEGSPPSTKPRVDEVVTVPTFRGKPLDFVPFVLAPDLDDPKPTLLDICRMSLAHYRNSADYEWALFMTAQPTPWATGATDDDKLDTIGPGKVWKIANPDARVGMLEFEGKGLAAQQQAMKDKEDRMAALGAYLIRGNVNRNESEQTARLRNAGETSALLKAVNAVEKTLKEVYRVAAVMVGADPAKVDITCNRDFIEAALSGDELLKYVKAWQGAEKGMKGPGIDDESFVNVLKSGELVDASKTTAEVIAAIEATKKRMDKLNATDRNQEQPTEEPDPAIQQAA